MSTNSRLLFIQLCSFFRVKPKKPGFGGYIPADNWLVQKLVEDRRCRGKFALQMHISIVEGKKRTSSTLNTSTLNLRWVALLRRTWVCLTSLLLLQQFGSSSHLTSLMNLVYWQVCAREIFLEGAATVSDLVAGITSKHPKLSQVDALTFEQDKVA